MAKLSNVKWTREHFLIALNLYCKLPFGKLHKGNPLIIEVAQKMGRTPSSLAMKLCNFASLDPVQKARGIKGLPGATKQDIAMWLQYYEEIATLGPESEQLLHDLFTQDDSLEVDFLQRQQIQLEQPEKRPLPDETETIATVKVRRGQQFFRQMVLNAYGIRCCISGINVPNFLVASHIKPWRDFPQERLNPRNGLCLSRLHDVAFDTGFLTLNENFQVVLSKRLKSYFPQAVLEQNFVPFEGSSISLPAKIAEPDLEFLAFHRREVFLG